MVGSIQPLLFGVSVFLVAEWLANKYADYVELSIVKEPKKYNKDCYAFKLIFGQ